MSLPQEIARRLTEEQIAFVKRSGLKAEVLEPGHVRLCMPLVGNQNSFDTERFYPIIKEMNLRFRRPATGDIRVEARLSATLIEQLQDEAAESGKAQYPLTLQLTAEDVEVVAESHALYQLRLHERRGNLSQIKRPDR